MSKVVAIIVNWNGGELAVECARSIMEQSIGPTLWVVDNASEDGSLEAIEAACPSAHIIRNSRNLGYAAANNQALRGIGEADFVLLVNNDVVLPEREALSRVIEYLQSHPEVHGACGRYEFPDGTFQRYYQQLPTAYNMFVSWGIGNHFRPFLRSKRTRAYYVDDFDFTKPLTVEQPAFACVLMRGESARAVGLMDEQFPIFFNDVDYCWRWRERGWGWRYFPEWRVVHHRGKSTAKIGSVLKAEVASSAARFARKYYSQPRALLIRCSIVLESLWRKYRYGDIPVSVFDIWQGKLFFCPESQDKREELSTPVTEETATP